MNAKSFFSLIAAVSFSTAFAAPKATIEFPLTGETYKFYKRKKPSTISVPINVPALNRKLKKHGLDGLPTKIVVSEKSKPYWEVLNKRITAATELVRKLEKNDRQELLFTIDHGYLHDFPAMCYRGETRDAVAVFQGMLGGFLTDEQGVEAIRWGKDQVVETEFFHDDKALKEAYEDNNPDEVAEWINYDMKSDAILVMSNLGAQGDGTELYATYIERCE